jgi:hypothetical protein
VKHEHSILVTRQEQDAEVDATRGAIAQHLRRASEGLELGEVECALWHAAAALPLLIEYRLVCDRPRA